MFDATCFPALDLYEQHTGPDQTTSNQHPQCIVGFAAAFDITRTVIADDRITRRNLGIDVLGRRRRCQRKRAHGQE